MPETLGLIDLKIARLNHRLRILEQQLVLSDPYPHHQVMLNFEYSQTRLELSRLVRRRQEFLQQAVAA